MEGMKMSEAQDRAKTMLTTALEMEEKGKQYYIKAAGTTKNELGREIWKLLADYEDKHTAKIKEIYDLLQGGQGWREEVAAMPVVSDLSQVFQKLAQQQKEHIKADTGDMEALGVGIEFEQASVKFYEDHLTRTEDPVEKKFTEAMVAEERGHLNLLTDMKFYYEDPEAWFMEKEKVGLDGQ
jgi:rubrerythrin